MRSFGKEKPPVVLKYLAVLYCNGNGDTIAILFSYAAIAATS